MKGFGTATEALRTMSCHEGLRARKQYNGVKIPVLPPAT